MKTASKLIENISQQICQTFRTDLPFGIHIVDSADLLWEFSDNVEGAFSSDLFGMLKEPLALSHPAPVVIVNMPLLSKRFDSVDQVDRIDDSNFVIPVVLHELAHVLDNGDGFSTKLVGIESTSKFFETSFAEFDDDCKGDLAWQRERLTVERGHPLSFIRAVCHIAYRWGTEHEYVSPHRIFRAVNYGLSPVDRYFRILQDECENLSHIPIRKLIHVLHHPDSSALWHSDLQRIHAELAIRNSVSGLEPGKQQELFDELVAICVDKDQYLSDEQYEQLLGVLPCLGLTIDDLNEEIDKRAEAFKWTAS